MKKKTLERHIKSLSGNDVFLRGNKYFRDGYIFNAVIQDQELRAECEGRNDTYRVYVNIDNERIKRVKCTCPYSRGARMCKHAVALLLTWINNPSEFRRIDSLNKILQNKSREDLIELIHVLVDNKPELLNIIEFSSLKVCTTYDREIYKRLIHLAWRQEPWKISLEIDKVRNILEKLIKNKEWKIAGNILATILDECVACYEPDYDKEGDIALSINEIASDLAQCLSNIQDAVIRKHWLQIMLKAELKDIELGGIGLAPSAHDGLIKQSSENDWEVLEHQIIATMDHVDGWKKEALENLLKKRRKKTY